MRLPLNSNVETVGKPNDPPWAHGRHARELNEMVNELAKCLRIELSFAFSPVLFLARFFRTHFSYNLVRWHMTARRRL